MSRSRDEATLREVKAVVVQLTAAWRERRFGDLEQLLDEEAVFVSPRFSRRREGRAACVETYRQFMAVAEVVEYGQHDLTIDVWGGTATVSYAFEMAWKMWGVGHREAGHDVLVLARGERGWRIVWRTLVTEPR